MSKAHEIVRTGMSFSEFIDLFPDDAAAERWFESHRWPDGPMCVGGVERYYVYRVV